MDKVWFRICGRFVSLAAVTYVDFKDDRAVIHFVGGGDPLVLGRGEADVFRWWWLESEFADRFIVGRIRTSDDRCGGD